MEINQFSTKTDITVDTLRYYDKIGLLIPQRINNRRCYTDIDIEKAKVITKLKNLNFSLDEIKTLFELEKDVSQDEALNDESINKVSNCLEIIVEKYNNIIKQEQDLIQVKQALKKMIDKTNRLLDLKYFFTD